MEKKTNLSRLSLLRKAEANTVKMKNKRKLEEIITVVRTDMSLERKMKRHQRVKREEVVKKHLILNDQALKQKMSDLNEEQQAVVKAVLNGDNVFFTGNAGTGKVGELLIYIKNNFCFNESKEFSNKEDN